MLENIKAQIQKLVSLYEKEKQRADGLAAELADKDARLKACKEQITELNQQIDNLKLQIAFGSGTDRITARERVSKLIREIDKCIELLEN